jgi:pyruvoyl-dependent arginine decarboxylase (PvlArgDC)
MARSATNEPNRLIAASIGLVNHKEDDKYGYLSEYPQEGKQHRKPEIMLKIWQWKCWLHPWGYQTIHL